MRVTVEPIQRWSPHARIWAGVGAVLLAALRAYLILLQSESPFVMADASHYMNIALGDYSHVLQPFASRQLGALVVTGLIRALHWTLERAFYVEAWVSLVVMLTIIFYLALQTKAPRWILLVLAIVPFWSMLLQYLVLPDLWYSALLAIMLLCMAEERMLLASLMMFPLMLSRESTSLTLVCFLIAAWDRLRWRDRTVAVVAFLAGGVVVSHLAARSQANIEHLPQALYMLAKIPWNFTHNILGIVPWSDAYTGFCKVPIWSMPLRFGATHAVGVCGFSTNSWVFIVQALLATFGLLPVLVIVLWRRRERNASRSALLRFALLYGTISLVLAPLLGVWFGHLIGYAWPLFLVALPMLYNEQRPCVPTGWHAVAAIGFVGLHLGSFYMAYRYMWWPQICIQTIFWIAGYFLIRYSMNESAMAAA